jgi:hypothetical protein
VDLLPRQAVLELMPQSWANFWSSYGWGAGGVSPRRLVLLAALCLALLPARGLGQGAVHYFADRSFEIPFEVDPGRPVRQFFLYASTDQGKNYKRYAAAAPGSGNNNFTFKADGDGWYWFVVQVEGLDARKTPENVNLAPPGLKVCVDTVRPTATLKPVAPEAGHTVAVEWEVSDVNLDLATLKLEYAPQGSDRWSPLVIRQMEHAQFSWSPPGAGSFDVRLSVSDRARNTATASTRVGAGASTGVGADTTPSNQRVKHVRSKRFKLNYKCDNTGPSGIKYVEIWMTRDTSSWTLLPNKAPAEGPCEVTVLSSGRYGFTLRPINGVGRGPEPPVSRQLPHVWIEVDETAPQVVLHSVTVGEGKDSGSITVSWQAIDKWFRAKPITISFAETADGPWTDLQTDLENTGTCRRSTEGIKPYQFYVRVKAVDEAGNEGYAVSKLVTVDTKIPTVVGIDVVVPSVDGPPKPPN